jgi:hypothetical protein
MKKRLVAIPVMASEAADLETVRNIDGVGFVEADNMEDLRHKMKYSSDLWGVDILDTLDHWVIFEVKKVLKQHTSLVTRFTEVDVNE